MQLGLFGNISKFFHFCGMSDELRWWDELRSGNQLALKNIYNAFYGSLMNYGLRLHSNQEYIEDCIQDLFVDLWRLKDNLGDTDSVRNYLIGSLRRRILRGLKANSAIQVELQVHHDKSDDSTDFELHWIQGEESKALSHKISKAMESLSKRQREAIYLKYSEGLDYDQICESMDLQYQSVRNLISTAVQRLREMMSVLIIFFLGN